MSRLDHMLEPNTSMLQRVEVMALVQTLDASAAIALNRHRRHAAKNCIPNV
jgi:hypothetical protein